MQGSAETRAQLFGGQGVHGIEPDWLTVEQMAVLACGAGQGAPVPLMDETPIVQAVLVIAALFLVTALYLFALGALSP